jgi:hypothetical protein
MPLIHFHSRALNHIVPYKPYQATVHGSNGMVVSKISANSIHFHNHRFSTDVEEIQEYLRKYPGFGRDYIELPPPVASADGSKPELPKTPPVTEIPGVKSKNDAVAYLVTERKISPTELHGKNAREVQAYALETAKVSFPDWKLPPPTE